MAKRGIQLQTELLTDEDFDNFLTIKGLLVIEVYSDWCGPCLGIVNALRRIKFDVGDILTLATARADTISYLNRFYKQSEPTWLFVNEGRAVNIMFGTNCPRLTKMIREEIGQLHKLSQRESYNPNELLPEEIKRNRLRNEAKDAKLREEKAAKERKKKEFFTYVTDVILDNLPDIGITVFGPHVNRDLYRKLMEFGTEKLGIQCKDRRNQPITKEQFEIINTVCVNPLPEEVIDVMDEKELFICYWKIPDDNLKRSVPEVMELYAEEVTKPQVLPPDEYRDTEEVRPPLVSSLKMPVEYELPDDQECPPEPDSEPEQPKKQKGQHDMAQDDADAAVEENVSEIGSEEDEEAPDEPKQLSLFDIEPSDADKDGEEEEDVPEEPKKNICKKMIKIPGIWVPKDRVTHAALIYVLFRQQTLSFLPPDPVPEPPHVIMAFNTYKQRDLIEFADRYKDDIPSYGYFTSDDAEEAKFIANSKQKYAQQTHTASDKLVFKVNKRTSHTMLSLVTYGPTYVSFDTSVGKQEALKFFPEDYLTAEKELLQLQEESKEKEKKSKKTGKDQKETDAYTKMQEEAELKAAEEAARLEEEKGAEQEGAAMDDGEMGDGEGGEGEGDTEGGDIGEGVEVQPGAGAEGAVENQPVQEQPAAEQTETVAETISPAEGAATAEAAAA